MKLTRRKFVKFGSAAGGALAIESQLSIFAKAMEFKVGGEGRRVRKKKGFEASDSWDKVVPYICMSCNIEDGGLAYIKNGRVEKVEGNPKHPSTRGRLCAKGNAAPLHIYDSDRILHPLKRTGPRGSGKWKRVSWDDALDEVAAKVTDVLDHGHANEIMFKYGRDRTGGAVGRFTSTLGTNTKLNHTSICESSKKIGMETTWGPDIEMPDFSNAKYILNWGSNIMETAYFMNPYAQRLSEGMVDNRAKLVTFDTRLSNTSGRSHERFFVFPGTDGLIALAMGNVILSEGLADEDFISTWTNVSVKELKDHYKQFTPEEAARKSRGPDTQKGGISRHDIIRIAREFANVKPYCTTYSYRGPCMHVYGTYGEKATMMLNILVGSVEHKGGYCLPRGMGYGQPQPKPSKGPEASYLASPPLYPTAGHHVSHHGAPYILDGRQKVKVYFNYVDNPVYTNPGADAVWGEMIRDEKLIPYYVTFSPFMSESTSYADIILPNAVFLERWEPESMPSSFQPWLGLRQPVVKPLGEAQEFRWTCKRLIDKIDPDGKRGMKKYWNFKSPEDYVRQQFEGVKGLKWSQFKKDGVFPIYGKTDNGTGRMIDKTGFEVKAEYGLHMKEDSKGKVTVNGKKRAGFGTSDGLIHINVPEFLKVGFNPMPTWKEQPWLAKMKKNEVVLSTYKVNVHTQSRTAGFKWLAEIYHKNHALINADTAANLGIETGDLIRVTTSVGYAVTKAKVTEGIHPRVVGISNHCGHWAYGRLAQAKANGSKEGWSHGADDPDLKNVWWSDKGVHINSIIPVMTDPIGGGQAWYSVVAKLEKAKSGDKYGTVEADTAKHMEALKETERYAYNGDMNRKMHPELKIDWSKLPKPALKGGH